jgi:signal transduction histidine kinase
MRQLQQSFEYANAVLSDRNGVARLELNSSFDDQATRREWTVRAQAASSVVVTELQRDPVSGRIFMAVVAPASDSGALILYIDAATFLFPSLKARPIPNASAEFVLSRVEGEHVVALSQLRYVPAAPLTRRARLSSAGLSQIRDIATGKPLTVADLSFLMKTSGNWYRIGPDYRGVKTYSILRLVPGTNWVLTTKVDVADANQPADKLLAELIIILILIVLVYAGGVALIWRNQQVRVFRAQIDTRNEILALSEKLVSSQEEERTRIARELHDHFSQDLAVIGIGLSCLERYLGSDPAASEQMERTRKKVVELAAGMRSLSHKLHPAVLEYSGLGIALAEYCEEFEARAGIHVDIDAPDALPELPPAMALAMYRIVQEGLQNVAKHAGVTDAAVEVRREGDLLRLRISDRGNGFNAGRNGDSFGLGLISMRERARQCGGTLELTSRPGHGTTLLLTFPAADRALAG